MSKLNHWHRVTEKDSKRIKCQCGDPAFACEHSEFTRPGGSKGISFWYYCHACAVKYSGDGLLADCMEVNPGDSR